MTASILQRADRADIRREHFPFIIVRDALPEDYYARLAETFPATGLVAGPGELDDNTAYRYPAARAVDNDAFDPLWREFFQYHTSPDFFAEVLDFWGDDIVRLFPGLEMRFGRPLGRLSSGMRHLGKGDNPANRDRDIRLDCQFVINSPVRTVSAVRGPHLDVPEKLFAALLYFRPPDDATEGGDLELYRLRPDRQIDVFDVVPYSANTLIMWINTPLSVHAVTPRAVTDISRRYVNFIGESYRLPETGFHGYYSHPAAG